MNWLEKILADVGITQYRLSKLTGISHQQIGKIIRTDVDMNDVKYGQVVKILSVSEALKNDIKDVEKN